MYRDAARLDPADVATRNLKSKLEQAVLFADNQQNPLTFNMSLSNEAGDLVSATESVSREILCSCKADCPAALSCFSLFTEWSLQLLPTCPLSSI